MDEDCVYYLQCPHCGTGWYGKFLGHKEHWNEDGKHILDEFMIQGWNPTNLTEPIYCLHCHKTYTPLDKEYLTGFDENKTFVEAIQFKDCELYWMEEFVARCLTTCKGH